ncbi:MAG: TRIC cation channel family protein [Acidimicrobiales bacterium]
MHVDVVAVLDVVGIYVFALSGGLMAVRRSMDVVGVLVLGLVTGFAGGVARDVLIGDLPPRFVRTEGLLLVPIVAALTILLAPALPDRLRQPVLVLDAVGLGLFATVGATRAVDAGLGLGATVLIGTVSAVGGGLVRDLLADQIPEILAEGSRLYAVPAALGALLVALGHRAELTPTAVQAGAVAAAVALRLASLRFGWHVPARVWRPRGIRRS